MDRVILISSANPFNPDSKEPVWFQGKVFEPAKDGTWQALFDEFVRTPWITYRNNFPAIEGSTLTSDGGWGCMIRSGQMMLARALIVHYMGKDWSPADAQAAAQLREILYQFLDAAGKDTPFSIHNICVVGNRDLEKAIGEWFGPNTVTYALEKCYQKFFARRPDVGLYVANDAMVYLDGVRAAMAAGGGAAMMFVPLRLGIDKLNDVYIPGLVNMFRVPQFCGVIGGIGKHSLYLVAVQGDQVIFLDPHTIQKSAMDGTREFSLETYTCPAINRIPINTIDPSLSLGFYVKSESDLTDLLHRLAELKKLYQQLFYIEEKAPNHEHVHTNDPGADEDDIIEF